MFARICLPFFANLFVKLFAHIFSSGVSGKKKASTKEDP